jgi:hypothetical protein
MVKDCFVINSPNIYWWFPTKEDAESHMGKMDDEELSDTRFTHSRCNIDDTDNNKFSEQKVLEVFIP